MFTEPVAERESAAFAHFLGARLLSTQVLTPVLDRKAYFASAASAGHVFFDPNTGIRLQHTHRARDPNYLYGDEIVSAVRERRGSLTLVFDQSVPRGSESTSIMRKLEHFSESGLAGFAYVSHACFVVLSSTPDVAARARKELLSHSRLPEGRVLAPSAA